jgi:hypothetical protein
MSKATSVKTKIAFFILTSFLRFGVPSLKPNAQGN